MSTAARTRTVHVFDVRSGVRASATVRRTGTAMDATPAEFAKLRAELRRQLLGALETCGLSPPDDFFKFVLQGTDFVVDSWAMLEELERHADAVMAHFEPPTYDVVENVASGFCVLEYACVLRTAGNADAYDGMVCGFPLLYTVANIAKYFGVCADKDVVAVSEYTATRVSVFSRRDGALLRRFGSRGFSDGKLIWPENLCFMGTHCHIAVADTGNRRISVFSVDGEFVRHVGVGKLRDPQCVASSAFDELAVACNGNIFVFSAGGELLRTMGDDTFSSVAIPSKSNYLSLIRRFKTPGQTPCRHKFHPAKPLWQISVIRLG
jgi:hypothetical protein